MKELIAKSILWTVSVGLVSAVAGCGSNSGDGTSTAVIQPSDRADDPKLPGGSATSEDSERSFKPLALGQKQQSGKTSGRTASAQQKMENVEAALKPLQILTGTWRGVTRKKIGGAASVEEPVWEWDYLTDEDQPALVMTSRTSPYLRKARLTYRVNSAQYELAAEDRYGEKHVYLGQLIQPIHDVPGEGSQLQRTFKLELTKISPNDQRRPARVVINQQENNRYLMEVHERRGGQITLFDTVANQRVGTSFAASLDDYGEKECIVSQGLGTTQVRHQGKSYWVCCTGCKTAFEKDPQRWIARRERRKAAK